MLLTLSSMVVVVTAPLSRASLARRRAAFVKGSVIRSVSGTMLTAAHITSGESPKVSDITPTMATTLRGAIRGVSTSRIHTSVICGVSYISRYIASPIR